MHSQYKQPDNFFLFQLVPRTNIPYGFASFLPVCYIFFCDSYNATISFYILKCKSLHFFFLKADFSYFLRLAPDALFLYNIVSPLHMPSFHTHTACDAFSFQAKNLLDKNASTGSLQTVQCINPSAPKYVCISYITGFLPPHTHNSSFDSLYCNYLLHTYYLSYFSLLLY